MAEVLAPAQALGGGAGLPDPGFAPAKINLCLHVTGQRADGYHLLDSLVVFAGLGDQVTATPSSELLLTLDGPFAQGVPTDGRNLVLRAARTLQEARGVTEGARLRLTKALPHAAGIGSGSSDAAAALRLLAKMWGVTPFSPYDPEVLALGADVPACLCAPEPVRMRGIGEDVSAVPALPGCGLVLVNPRVEVPTGPVFAALESRENAPMEAVPERADFEGFCAWLGRQRNDLRPGSELVAPEVSRVLARLSAQRAVRVAVMSGSGATCVGITRDVGEARQVARAIQVAEMGWWVVPAAMLG